jgi:hypothetical protein
MTVHIREDELARDLHGSIEKVKQSVEFISSAMDVRLPFWRLPS